jgi:hypothetical protein
MRLTITAVLVCLLSGCAGFDVRQGLGQRDNFSRQADGSIEFTVDGTQKQETLIAELDGDLVVKKDGTPDMSKTRFKRVFWRRSEPTDVAANAYARAVESQSKVLTKALDIAAYGMSMAPGWGGGVPSTSPTTNPTTGPSEDPIPWWFPQPNPPMPRRQ